MNQIKLLFEFQFDPQLLPPVLKAAYLELKDHTDGSFEVQESHQLARLDETLFQAIARAFPHHLAVQKVQDFLSAQALPLNFGFNAPLF